MFPYLSQDIQNELAQLSQLYNQPLVRTVNLGQTSQFDPLSRTDRYGEVCMVVRRPNGLLLTMLKQHYDSQIPGDWHDWATARRLLPSLPETLTLTHRWERLLPLAEESAKFVDFLF